MKHKGKMIADGAICTALTVLLLILTLYLPAFAMLSVMIAGLPLVFLAARAGIKCTLLAAVASVLVLGIVAGDFLSAMLLGVINLLPGVGIGYAISRRKGFRTTVMISGGAMLMGLLFQVMIINAGSGGSGIATMIDGTIEGSKQMLQDMTTQTGMQEQALTEKMLQTFAMAKEMLLLYLPAMLIGLSAVLGYGAAALAIFMLRRVQKLKIPYLPFSQIQAPRGVCYLSMALSVGVLLIQEGSVTTAAFQNLALLTDCFIGVCGLSWIDYKLSHRITSGYVRAGIYAVALVVGYLAIGLIAEILVFLGMLDGLFYLRRVRKVGEGYGKES